MISLHSRFYWPGSILLLLLTIRPRTRYAYCALAICCILERI